MTELPTLNIVDAGPFNRPICQAKIEALARHARETGKTGAQITCLGITVIVLATGEHMHIGPSPRVIERATPTNGTPRDDRAQP